MKNPQSIRSLFALPGFVAGGRLNGVFGDRYARIILVEGINNKIRVLQRRAYGYRDDEYLKLKIVAAFLPQLPRNAVFNPHESA